MSAESVLSVVTILILVPLCGVIFALTPWLTPKGELFSVSVPTAAASDPRARSLKRAYSLWVLVVTALLTGWVSYVLVAIHPNMAALVSCVAVVVLVLFGYFLMLHYRDKAQDLKQRFNSFFFSIKSSGRLESSTSPSIARNFLPMMSRHPVNFIIAWVMSARR